MLQQLGFGQIWRDIISGLLSTSSTCVLLNGSPGDLIINQRGPRQGDPLSSMLFILVMDILGHLVIKAKEEGLLLPLSSRPLRHRISIFADDVVLFICPEASDIEVTLDILQLFGDASGLRNNIHKSNVFPIRCGENEMAAVHDLLLCGISFFLCKYLGIPLSLEKLTREQIQPIIDWIADQPPGWKSDMMNRDCRRIQVQYVLTSMLVYLAMSLDKPMWALKAIDKIRRC